jgi:hypothetical protein
VDTAFLRTKAFYGRAQEMYDGHAESARAGPIYHYRRTLQTPKFLGDAVGKEVLLLIDHGADLYMY